jgi:hypothetical protein
MKRTLLVVGVIALFIGANYALLSGDYSADDDLLVISLIVGIGVMFGLLIGRWWALLLPLAWLPLNLLEQGSESELSTFGVVILTLGITAPLQAVGLAAGVLIRVRV